jgi:hypothetical protein
VLRKGALAELLSRDVDGIFIAGEETARNVQPDTILRPRFQAARPSPRRQK